MKINMSNTFNCCKYKKLKIKKIIHQNRHNQQNLAEPNEFQFYIVRLKNFPANTGRLQKSFQFYIVRLKGGRNSYFNVTALRFNSI